MGREGEGVGKEEQDETRQGRAELRREGKSFSVGVFCFLTYIFMFLAARLFVLFVMLMNSGGWICHIPLYGLTLRAPGRQCTRADEDME